MLSNSTNMRKRSLKGVQLAVMGLMLAVLPAMTVAAQNSPNTTPAPNQTAPVQLSVEVWDVLKMVQSKVPDETILAYINNSGRTYNLGPSEIIYLREQGASEPVLTGMLNHRSTGTAPVMVPSVPVPTATPPPASPAPAVTEVAPSQPPVATTPATTYVQPSTVYVAPPAPVYSYYYPSYGYYYPYPYYRYYPYSPSVSLSFGFGFGGWHGGHGGHGGLHAGHR